jgi:hypothetical protein
LESIQDMLPYLAAAGHNLYAKSAYIYLNQMQALRTSHPDIHEMFCKGYHVIRRSNRFWAGISIDLAIEQILMRSIKSSGGLTRGRGLGEAQRNLWLLSMPICSEINEAMQILTRTKYQANDQHVEASKSRTQRDCKDISTIIDYLRDHDPFTLDNICLRNIETGVIAAEHVNADRARDVGLGILQDMSSKFVTEYSFKRKYQVVPLHSKKASKEDTDVPFIQIDPQLMFQRLVIAGDGHFTDNSELFKFELSSLPSSMFDNNGYPREASKSLLADAIWDDQCLADCKLEQDAQYVLDGGSLLQRIPWEMGTTFSKLCSVYIEHVKRTYRESIVVFDGYPDHPTLKDTTHLRRSKGYKTTDVVFTETTPCKMKKRPVSCQ